MPVQDYHSYAAKKQYRFAQENPRSYDFSSDDTAVTINGKIASRKDWFNSRPPHKRMARKWSLTTQHNLTTLLSSQDDLIVFNGNLRMPNASSDDWKLTKRKFNEQRRYWEKTTGHRLAIIAKQHITKNRHDSQYADDMHFDYVGWTDAPLSQRNLSHLINGWWKKAGGKSASAKIVEDTSPDNLNRVCNYCYKFPDTKETNFTFNRFHYLPLPRKQSGMSVTWNCGKFFLHDEKEIRTEYQIDGRTKTKTITAPFALNWHSWKVKTFGSSECIIKTSGYRLQEQAQAVLQNFSQAACPIKSIGKITEKSEPLITHKTASHPVNYLALWHRSREYGHAHVARCERQSETDYYAIRLHTHFLSDDMGNLVLFDASNLKQFSLMIGCKPPERPIDAPIVWFGGKWRGDDPHQETPSTALSA